MFRTFVLFGALGESGLGLLPHRATIGYLRPATEYRFYPCIIFFFSVFSAAIVWLLGQGRALELMSCSADQRRPTAARSIRHIYPPPIPPSPTTPDFPPSTSLSVYPFVYQFHNFFTQHNYTLVLPTLIYVLVPSPFLRTSVCRATLTTTKVATHIAVYCFLTSSITLLSRIL